MLRRAWRLLLLLTLANFLHYATRNVAFSMYGELRARFAVDDDTLGLIGTAFMTPHAIGTAVLAWLSDHMDRSKVLIFGVVTWSAALLLGASATSMPVFLLSRAFAGLGTAACVPIALAIICDTFPGAITARAASVFNSGLLLGGAFGIWLGRDLGFPLAMWALGLSGFGLAALLLVSSPRTKASSTPVPRREIFQGLLGDARNLWAIVALRRTCMGAVLMAFASGGYLAWFVEFLVQKGLSKRATEMLIVLTLLGGLLGVLSGGVIADRLRKRSPRGRFRAVTFGLSAAIPFALGAIFFPAGLAFFVSCFAMMFFVNWYHAPLAASIGELAPQGQIATAQGLCMFLMHLLGTAPSSWLVGLVSHSVGLERALLLPTLAMACAALVFVAVARTQPTRAIDAW